MTQFIKTGVIGHPIKHSKSPLIHTHWIAQHGLNGSYEALDIKPEDLPARLPQLLKEEGYTGFNLTIPHKEIAINICDEIDDLGRAIGAVNTVKITEDGRIIGTNTDAFGFIENIKQDQPNVNFTKGRAVVLGAGGAARAIIYGLLQEGVPEIIVTNRTLSKAQDLTKLDPTCVKAVEWDQRSAALEGANMVVNTTALGMNGQPALDISLDALPTSALVSDIVYAPLMTDLLTAAQDRGNAVVTGIGMLLHQARPAFQLWYGPLPSVTQDLQDIVKPAEN